LRANSAAALLAFAALAASGCGTSRHAPSHVLRVAMSVEPASLSPLTAFAQNQIAYDQLWCQALIGLDERNRAIPLLVTRVPSRENGDIASDGKRITYHLRREIRFADGVPLTAADVAFTYRAILDPANKTADDEAYRRIATLATPDAQTVVVTLRKPWSGAVRELFAQADFVYGILPRHAFRGTLVTGTPWESTAFGSGPFRVVSWRRSDRIVLEPNPYFRPRPKLQRIVLRLIPNPVAAFNALRAHEVDVATLTTDNVADAAHVEGVRVVRIPENGSFALYMQTVAGPTRDVRLRRAIADALDLPSIGKAARGVFPPSSSFFAAPIVSWPASRPPAFADDLAAAARELDAAGWRLQSGVRVKDGMPLQLVCAVNAEVPVMPRVAIIVQERLARLGIAVTVKAYPYAQFTAPDGPERTGHFSLLVANYIGGADPEASINLLCEDALPGGPNFARYCSPRLEALYTAQMNARGERERERDFVAIARLVHDDVPLVPLFDEVYLEGVDVRVSGYRKNMLRFPVHPEEWDAKS
jgi:peptide/nickel transport system substrate-binding protein